MGRGCLYWHGDWQLTFKNLNSCDLKPIAETHCLGRNATKGGKEAKAPGHASRLPAQENAVCALDEKVRFGILVPPPTLRCDTTPLKFHHI